MRYVVISGLILGGLAMSGLAGCAEAPAAQAPAPVVKKATARTLTQTRSCDDRFRSVTVTVGPAGREAAAAQAGTRAYALLAQDWLDAGHPGAAWRCVQEALPEAGIGDDDPGMAEARALLGELRTADAAAAGILRLQISY